MSFNLILKLKVPLPVADIPEAATVGAPCDDCG